MPLRLSYAAEEYNEIRKAYIARKDDLDLAMCVTRARTLLAEPTISRYHRIRTLLLLSRLLPLDDYEEACRLHRDADFEWREGRACEVSRGISFNVDTALDKLKKPIEEMREVLANRNFSRAFEKLHQAYNTTHLHEEVAARQCIARAQACRRSLKFLFTFA